MFLIFRTIDRLSTPEVLGKILQKLNKYTAHAHELEEGRIVETDEKIIFIPPQLELKTSQKELKEFLNDSFEFVQQSLEEIELIPEENVCKKSIEEVVYGFVADVLLASLRMEWIVAKMQSYVKDDHNFIGQLYYGYIKAQLIAIATRIEAEAETRTRVEGSKFGVTVTRKGLMMLHDTKGKENFVSAPMFFRESNIFNMFNDSLYATGSYKNVLH